MAYGKFKRSLKTQRRNAKRMLRRPQRIPLLMKRAVGKLGYSESTHLFKRKVQLGPVTVSGAGASSYTGANVQFMLQDLPNYTELTALFDQYTIRYIKWYLVCRASNTSLVESAVTSFIGMPNIICTRDYDSSTAPASSAAGYATIQEYSRSKSFSFTPDKRVFSIGLKPATLQATYISAISTGYTAKFNQVVDCANPDVKHYGLLYVIQVPASAGMATNVVFDSYATFYLAMKNVR